MSSGEYHCFHRASSAEPHHLEHQAAESNANWPAEWWVTYTKDYPRLPFIELPHIGLPAMAIEEALLSRASVRTPGQVEVGVEHMAALLQCGLGLRPSTAEDPLSRRRYPSGGARFTTEAYVWVAECSGLVPGLYYYVVPRHGLRLLRQSSRLQEERRTIFAFDWICQARVIIVLSAVMWRSHQKYGERAYRYAHLEAGHVMQNLCLAATALGLGLTPVGGFADAALWDFLDLGDPDEIPLYVAAVP